MPSTDLLSLIDLATYRWSMLMFMHYGPITYYALTSKRLHKEKYQLCWNLYTNLNNLEMHDPTVKWVFITIQLLFFFFFFNGIYLNRMINLDQSVEPNLIALTDFDLVYRGHIWRGTRSNRHILFQYQIGYGQELLLHYYGLCMCWERN